MNDPNSPAAWVEFAEEDLRTARIALEASPPLVRSACFHVQQCAEKYLKGYLVSKGSTFPKTHDLGLLLHRCAAHDNSMQEIAALCDLLNEFIESGRYPAKDVAKPSLDDARHGLNAAIQVAQFVSARLTGAATPPR
jgi:HEPN domain-containing protein